MKQVPQSWVKFQELLANYKHPDNVKPTALTKQAKCSSQLPTHFIKAGYIVKTENGYKYNGPKDFTHSDWINVLKVYKQYNDAYNQRILDVDISKPIESQKSKGAELFSEKPTLKAFTDAELLDELKSRGYTGMIEKKQTINF